MSSLLISWWLLASLFLTFVSAKLFGTLKPFLVYLYLKTDKCIRLKRLVWREPLFISKIRQLCNRKVRDHQKVSGATVIWASPSFGYPHTQIPIRISGDTQNTESVKLRKWNQPQFCSKPIYLLTKNCLDKLKRSVAWYKHNTSLKIVALQFITDCLVLVITIFEAGFTRQSSWYEHALGAYR